MCSGESLSYIDSALLLLDLRDKEALLILVEERESEQRYVESELEPQITLGQLFKILLVHHLSLAELVSQIEELLV